MLNTRTNQDFQHFMFYSKSTYPPNIFQGKEHKNTSALTHLTSQNIFYLYIFQKQKPNPFLYFMMQLATTKEPYKFIFQYEHKYMEES